MKLRRIIFFGGAFLLVLVKFTFDVITKNVDLDPNGLGLIREIVVLGAFTLVYVLINAMVLGRESSPVRKLGIILIVTGGMVVVSLVLGAFGVEGFDAKNLA